MLPKAKGKVQDAAERARAEAAKQNRARQLVEKRKEVPADYRKRYDDQLAKVREKRWDDVRVVGLKIGTKTVVREPRHILAFEDEEETPEAANDTVAPVYAFLDSYAIVRFAMMPSGAKKPSLIASLDEVNLASTYTMIDLQGVALPARRQVAKALATAEASINPSLRITKIEAELAVTYSQCLERATGYVKYNGLCPLDPDENLATISWSGMEKNEEDRGLAKLKELRGAYGTPGFAQPEIIAIGASFLNANYLFLPPWLKATELWDALLFAFNTQVFVSQGRAKTRAVSVVHNIPSAIDGLHPIREGEEALREVQTTNGLTQHIIKSRLDLARLAAMSPISVAVLRTPPEDLLPMVSLASARQHVKRGTRFAEWIDFLYIQQAREVNYPQSIAPATLAYGALGPTATDATHQELQRAAEELAEYTHLEIIIMGWRDFLVPAAVRGDSEDLSEMLTHLLAAAHDFKPDEDLDYPFPPPVADNEDDDEDDDEDMGPITMDDMQEEEEGEDE